MRIERQGAVLPLAPRVTRYMVEVLGARSLDDVQKSDERRADYSCLNGLLCIELKSLEDDASERMENLADQLRQRDDWPAFYGAWPVESVVKNMREPEIVRRHFTDRAGRAIINHLKKANKQLAAHAKNFPRKNLVRAMLLINEDHEIYTPEITAFILGKALRRRNNDGYVYSDVDCVIYISERHMMRVENQIALAIISVEGSSMLREYWKRLVINQFTQGWADWNRQSLYDVEVANAKFTVIESIPESAPRSERWQANYRRNPHLRFLTDDQLRDRFDEINLLAELSFMRGSPVSMPIEATTGNMENLTHIMEEMAHRGISVSAVQQTSERSLAAAHRLRMPTNILGWLKSIFSDGGVTSE